MFIVFLAFCESEDGTISSELEHHLQSIATTGQTLYAAVLVIIILATAASEENTHLTCA